MDKDVPAFEFVTDQVDKNLPMPEGFKEIILAQKYMYFLLGMGTTFMINIAIALWKHLQINWVP